MTKTAEAVCARPVEGGDKAYVVILDKGTAHGECYDRDQAKEENRHA